MKQITDETRTLISSLAAQGVNGCYVQILGQAVKVTFYEQYDDRPDIFPKGSFFMGRDVFMEFLRLGNEIMAKTEHGVSNPIVFGGSVDGGKAN